MRAILIDHIRDGKEAAPSCQAAIPDRCPMCGTNAVLPLNEATLAVQPDGTTHVCHPVLDGCNHGFAQEPTR